MLAYYIMIVLDMTDRIIVTHRYPDVDALMSVWLVKRFGGKRWEDAAVEFIAHGATYSSVGPDEQENILHVDTGGGMLDHHDTIERTCAAQKVYHWLNKEDEVLERMVAYAVAIDHFEDVDWNEPLSDLYDFGFAEMMAGAQLALDKTSVEQDQRDQEVMAWALTALDGVYESLNGKIKAIEQIAEHGAEIETRFGKALAIQSFNDEILRVALKQGYVVVMRRDPLKKYVRIKAHPHSPIDLTYLYQKLIALDPEATWFLHSDKKQLLNGSTGNQDRVVTELEFQELVDLIASI